MKSYKVTITADFQILIEKEVQYPDDVKEVEISDDAYNLTLSTISQLIGKDIDTWEFEQYLQNIDYEYEEI